MRPFAIITVALLFVVSSVFTAPAQEPSAKYPARPSIPSRTFSPRIAQEPSAKYPARPATSEQVPPPMPPSMPAPKYLASEEVLVSWSEKGDAIWGFSKSVGKWTKQEIQPEPKDELVPILDGSVGGLQVGNAVYAFSSQTGHWDVLRLPSNRKPKMSVRKDLVLVTDGTDVHTFANSTGRWSSPDAATSEADKPNRQVRVFFLVYSDAQSMSGVVSQLFRDVVVAADQRTNTLIATGSPDDLAVIEALLLRLDQPPPDRTTSPTPADLLRTLRKGAQANAGPQPAVLAEKYNQLEQQAAQLAEQHRALPLKASRKPGDAEAFRRQLTDVVKEAFEARQKLQRAELDELRQRLAGVEQRIAARERIKDVIIDRRVQELLNPDLAWERPAEPLGQRKKPAEDIGVDESVVSEAGKGAIGPFESGGIGSSISVGVVHAVNDDGSVVISAKELNGIREGEELVLERPELVFEDGTTQYRRFALVRVASVTPHSAVARAVALNRVLKDNEYVFEEIQVGDLAGRPVIDKASRKQPTPEPLAEARTKPDAQALQLLSVAQQRWELLFGQYRAGVTELGELLPAGKELLEARLATAENAEVRQSVLQAQIKLLNDVKTAVEAKFRAGLVPQADVLSVEGTLLSVERQLAAEQPAPPMASTVTQPQVNLTLFEATERATEELGLPAFQHPGNWRPMPMPPDLFRKKLEDMVRDGQANVLAGPLVTTLGRPKSFALSGWSRPLNVTVTQGESDALRVEIVGLERVGGGDCIVPAKYGQSTIAGPFVCTTEGRRAFVCLTVTALPPPPTGLPRPLPAGTAVGVPGASSLDAIAQLEAELAALRQTHGPEHPKIREIESRLEAMGFQRSTESQPRSSHRG